MVRKRAPHLVEARTAGIDIVYRGSRPIRLSARGEPLVLCHVSDHEKPRPFAVERIAEVWTPRYRWALAGPSRGWVARHGAVRRARGGATARLRR